MAESISEADESIFVFYRMSDMLLFTYLVHHNLT